jgi:hypothetical protein
MDRSAYHVGDPICRVHDAPFGTTCTSSLWSPLSCPNAGWLIRLRGMWPRLARSHSSPDTSYCLGRSLIEIFRSFVSFCMRCPLASVAIPISTVRPLADTACRCHGLEAQPRSLQVVCLSSRCQLAAACGAAKPFHSLQPVALRKYRFVVGIRAINYAETMETFSVRCKINSVCTVCVCLRCDLSFVQRGP